MPFQLQAPCKFYAPGGGGAGGRLSSAFITTTTRTDTHTRPFSTTPPTLKKPTKLRRDFFAWLAGPGAIFKQPPEANHTNYLGQYDPRTGEPREGARQSRLPFPQNPVFLSTPVASDDLANEVYRRIVYGKTVRMVSAELNVSLQRVAAIYRLKTVESNWEAEGKPLKRFLTKAIHGMLPTTPAPRVSGAGGDRGRGVSEDQGEGGREAHEPINDLPSHQLTHAQLFIPVSESREFTRKDAGEAFGLPAADELIPHPELIIDEREKIGLISVDERRKRAIERDKEEIERKEEAERKKREREAKAEMVRESGRWVFRLQDVKAGEVGHRYGIPHEDRKKGQVKIPTRVE